MIKGDNLPDALKKIPGSLGISNEKALILIVSLHNLLKEYIATSMIDETILSEQFPPDFKK
jgi:hypothetical protein